MEDWISELLQEGWLLWKIITTLLQEYIFRMGELDI